MACTFGTEQGCNECRMCGNGKGGKKMTNFEWIKGMSVKESAEFLSSDDFEPCQNCDYLFKDAMNESCNAPSGFACTKTYAAALIQKWLESECEAE